MCRLLGVVSSQSAPLAKILDPDLTAFAELSELHCDGWGHAYLTEHDLVVAKAAEAARDSAGFWSSVSHTDTDAALLHLRMASPGMATDRLNTHPFERGGTAFAHNGYASPRSALDALVHDHGAPRPHGSTDSERYFSLVLAGLRGRPAHEALWWAAGLIATRADVAYSLNALLLTHDALYAFEWWRPDAPPRPEAGEASYRLFYRAGPEAVTVASDGWESTEDGWEHVGNGNVLEIHRHTLVATVHEGPDPALA